MKLRKSIREAVLCCACVFLPSPQLLIPVVIASARVSSAISAISHRAVSMSASAYAMMFTPPDIYIAATGTGSQSGLDCSNLKPVSYFNTSGNWSLFPTGSQIGPDSFVHVTGTFTGTLGAQALAVQGSGTSGHIITVKADSCGGTVDFTSPAWSSNGAITTNGKDYITLDGGGTGDANAGTFSTVGTIENTANGTALTNQVASKGIVVPKGTNIEIKNWAILNIYQRSGHTTEVFDDTTAACIYSGTTGVVNQYKITNNKFDKAGWCIQNVGASDYIEISHNDIGNMEHSGSIAPVTLMLHHNHIHDWALWDGPCPTPCGYHHDGWHDFAGSGGQTQFLYYFDNQCDGAVDDGIAGDGQFNQCLFIEGNGSPTTGMIPGGRVIMFNNIGLIGTSAPGDLLDTGNSTTGNNNDIVANNTTYGPSGNDSSVGIKVQASTNATIVNNAIGHYGILISTGGGSGPILLTQVDYQRYENCSGFNCFDTSFVDTGSFTTWKAANCTGSSNTCDQHGSAGLAVTTRFGLDAGCVVGSVNDPCRPQVGSVLINAGLNLTFICSGQPRPGLGDLCYDKFGVQRPTTGPWTIGAVQEAGVIVSPPVSPSRGGTFLSLYLSNLARFSRSMYL